MYTYNIHEMLHLLLVMLAFQNLLLENDSILHIIQANYSLWSSFPTFFR